MSGATKKKKHKAGPTQPVQLGPLKKRGRVRIRTVSWSDVKKRQSRDHFLASIGGSSRGVDLVLCAGRPVKDIPKATAVLQASGGVPVLYEARKRGRWQLAYEGEGGPTHVVLRHQQVVKTSGDDRKVVRRLLGAIAKGEGRIRFAGSDLTMLLLICGENNVLRSPPGASVFGVKDAGYDEQLGQNWLVLNPAHTAYWPRNKYSGFGKVGKIREKGITRLPLLERAARADKPCRDGSVPPLAIVHANQWHEGHADKTLTYSARAFTRGGLLAPRKPAQVQQTEGATFTSVVFDVPL